MKNELTGWYVASVAAPIRDRVSKHVYPGNPDPGWRPCMEWCVETFGGGIGATVSGPGWRFVGKGVFEFKREQDRTLFLLRWN